MPPSSEKMLGVSTTGNRQQRKGRNGVGEDTIEIATARVLEQVEHASSFFDQVEPYTLPEFTNDEIEPGDFLGRGEFGDVWEVKSIAIQFECPCQTCGEEGQVLELPTPPPPAPLPSETVNGTYSRNVEELKDATTAPTLMDRDSTTNTTFNSMAMGMGMGMGMQQPIQIIVDENTFQRPNSHVDLTDTVHHNFESSISMPSALNKHKRTSSVSFADHVISSERDELNIHNNNNSNNNINNINNINNSNPMGGMLDFNTQAAEHNFIEDHDDSTLSTNEEEDSVANMMWGDEDVDGEVTFLKGFMTTHTKRHGVARYAIKQARKDLSPDVLLEAVVDLAVEAKFLATVRHPNIVRMRGTVSKPGSPDFMIIMDRLRMTLREKMKQWRQESKGKTGILSKLLRSQGDDNHALQREQYADKLLAVYDIARAMRYLHNHMIIYRDLKPENVAFDVRGDMRLFDFGLVKELKARDLVEPPDGFAATGLTGSRRYMAPEVCACKNYGLKADVYSFAIVFWEVFSGQEAYHKMSFDKHFDQVVVKGKRPNTKAASSATRLLSKSLLYLMPEMWHSNPQQRPTFMNICDRLAGECLLSNRPPRKDSDQSHQSHLTDRTRYLMNRSLASRYSPDVLGDSSDSAGKS